MRIFKIISALLLLICLQACAQKKAESIGKKVKKITLQDSVKLKKYAQQIDKAPLFSSKRQRYLDSILLVVPTDAYAWQQKAMPLFKQKKYELGMSYLDSAVKYDQSNHYLEYRAFIKCIFQKSYRSAIKDFDAIQKIKGNSYVMDHTYEFYKGLCYLQLNQFNTAEQLFTKNINEDRIKLGDKWINCSSLFYQGVCFYELGKYPKAIESFNECIARYSNFSDAKYYRAICLQNIGKKKEALVLVKEAESDFKIGYSIPETNAMYEIYPYQVNKFLLQYYREELEGKRNE